MVYKSFYLKTTISLISIDGSKLFATGQASFTKCTAFSAFASLLLSTKSTVKVTLIFVKTCTALS
ncbi:osmotically inducible protein C [Listeria monocytogenes]|nr:osmotically inducible protein C [Listeria monocytogenes]